MTGPEPAVRVPDVLLRCRGLSVGYRGKALLPPIDLEIARGELLLILGRNGSGKTTLVRTLLGLVPALAGDVRWAAGMRRSFVPQSGTIDHDVPVRAADVAGWGRLRAWSFLWPFPRRGDAAARDAALAALGVAALGKHKLRELSGGQVQRVLFARMLAGDTDVAVLDEPTAAMDATGERAVYRTLRKLARERGIAVVVVTHAVSAAMGACDRVLLLDPDDAGAGRVVVGTPDEVGQDAAFRSLFGVAARPDRLATEGDHAA